MVGGTVGKVVHANNSAFQVGDIVAGYWGWQEFAVSGGHKLRNMQTYRLRRHEYNTSNNRGQCGDGMLKRVLAASFVLSGSPVVDISFYNGAPPL